MALKHLVLGLLTDQPDHGYRLKHRISPGLPREELVNDGVLYPLLRRMEEDGLLESSEEEARGRTRRVFATTAAGRREFRRWMASDEDEGQQPRYLLYADHPLAKLLFGKHLTPELIEEKLATQRELSRQRIEALEALRALAPPAPESLNELLFETELAQHRERMRFLERQRQPAGSSGGTS
jgi:DNA-binding PadR family transcriptional regulator